MVDELEVLRAIGVVEPPSPEVFERARLAAFGVPTADGETTVVRRHRVSRRHRLFLVGGAALAAASVAGVGGLFATPGGGRSIKGAPSGVPGAAKAAGQPATPSVAGIEARLVSAVYRADTSMIFESSGPTPRGSVEILSLGSTNVRINRDRNGSLVQELAARQTVSRGTTTYSRILIDFAARTFSRQETAAATPASLPTRLPPGAALAGQIQSDLENGRAVVKGIVGVNGHSTREIQINLPGGSSSTFWVDLASGLPVQTTTPTGTVTYQWLPPTPSNLSALAPTPPAGFTEIPFPTGG